MLQAWQHGSMVSLLPATERALLKRLAVEQSQNRVPSLIAALVRDGETIWLDSRGQVDEQPVTSNTQYRIGSITKSLVGVLVMRLRDEGLVTLTDVVDSYVPGTAVGGCTVAELLSHSSSLTAEPEGPWWERTPGTSPSEFLATIDETQRRPAPEHVFHYSNVGFGILGELVARARGKHWSEVLKQEVLDPLEMTRTTPAPMSPHAEGWAVHPWADVLMKEPAEDAGAMAPAGQLWSTVDDMVRWLRFVTGDTCEVLHPDTVKEMRTPVSVDDGNEWNAGYGLGFQLMRHGGRRLATPDRCPDSCPPPSPTPTSGKVRCSWRTRLPGSAPHCSSTCSTCSTSTNRGSLKPGSPPAECRNRSSN